MWKGPAHLSSEYLQEGREPTESTPGAPDTRAGLFPIRTFAPSGVSRLASPSKEARWSIPMESLMSLERAATSSPFLETARSGGT